MSGALLLAVVTAGLLSDSVFTRMFLLGGNTRSGPEPSLESLSAFVWEELIFLSHNIKPPIFVGLVLLCARQEPPGGRRRRRRNLF